MFWEENFTPLSMRSCGRRNVRKHKEINNGEQYIALDIFLQLDFLENREVTYSGSWYYVGISGMGINNFLYLMTRMGVFF